MAIASSHRREYPSILPPSLPPSLLSSVPTYLELLLLVAPPPPAPPPAACFFLPPDAAPLAGSTIATQNARSVPVG